VLLRHGQSEWNAGGRFTGSTDVDLSSSGRRQAVRAGEQLSRAGLGPTVVHTSILRRATHTTELLLAAAAWQDIRVKRTPQLNERSYGDLEGRTKSEVRAECGDELFDLWRRSYRVAPPAASDGRRGESLEDVFRRVVPYWRTAVRADLDAGERVLLVGHGSSLRALVKELDSVSDAAITGINIPTGMPLVYELDHDLRPVTPAGRYLEPVAAMQAASAVANEGREEVP
jgi:2,3-bisphosphoglycerate-dependent phosphoglycerate mutase